MVTGEQIFSVVWEAIERLEQIDFKVIAITCDGASPNWKLFHMHCSGSSTDDDSLCYKCPNPYTREDRSIYFFSDVPHLMKTTRNCWSHSSKEGTRNLWVNETIFSNCNAIINSYTCTMFRLMERIFCGSSYDGYMRPRFLSQPAVKASIS